MKFAFSFPYRRILRYQSYRERETFIELVKRADELGFDAFSAGDHLFMPKYWQHVATEVWFDPFTFLSYAGAISKLRVLTDVVVVPYRTPFHTAKSIATLDFITGGKVIFGAAVGYLEGEFNTLKVPFRERGPMTDEYLEIMKVLWSSEKPRYEGKVLPGRRHRVLAKAGPKTVPTDLDRRAHEAVDQAGDQTWGWLDAVQPRPGGAATGDALLR